MRVISRRDPASHRAARSHVWSPVWRDRRGTVATEYAVLAAMVAITAIIGVFSFGGSINEMWIMVGQQIAGALLGG